MQSVNIVQNYGNSEHTHSEPYINGHLNTHILHTYVQYICVKRMAHTQFLCKSCKRCVYTHTPDTSLCSGYLCVSVSVLRQCPDSIVKED